jgi:sirohydrochlorin cobaltochelatase
VNGRPALLLGHGSPDAAAQRELLELRALVGRRLGLEVGLGVLEFPAVGIPGLDEAFAGLRGHGSVAAQPLILFDGLHGRHDMPETAARATSRLGLDVRLGDPFGRDPRLVDLVTDRLIGFSPGEGDLLLFVGRGSSEPLALDQTEEVAEAVSRRAGIGRAVCYTGISRPSLEEGLQAALDRRPGRVLALPYLLHTGVLLRRVSEILVPIARREGIELIVLPHIGNAPAVVEVIAGRLQRLMAGADRVADPLGTVS